MKQVSTYLNFDGNCRQAMQFYQKCPGAELQLTSFMNAHGKPSTEPGARIMLGELLRNGQCVHMVSDTQPGMPLQFGNNFHVSIDCDSIEEIGQIFAALSQNGRVRIPLADAPWGARFGMLIDQFGVQWMLNCFRHVKSAGRRPTKDPTGTKNLKDLPVKAHGL